VKLFKLAIIAVAMVANVGCTTMKGWFNDEPLTAEQEKKIVNRNNGIKVPDGYNNPAKSNEFVIPKNIQHRPNAETITSPTSVLVILEKSWINEEDNHLAKIMVEQPDLVDDFPQFIENGIQSYQTHMSLNIEPISETQYQIEYITYEESGLWFWKSKTEIEKVMLMLNVDMVKHGRSGQIYVDAMSYAVENQPSYPLPNQNTRKEALSIQVLNELMLELDYQYRVYLKKEQAGIDVTLAVAKNSSNLPVLVSQQEITYVYSQLEDILEQLGFDIEDEDKLLHSYKVSYLNGDQSMWDSLFNAAFANKLDIPNGEYKVELTSSIKGVYIKFTSVDGIPFSEQQVDQAYELIMLVIEEEELEI
jgi:uncharacterized lipoprotein